MPASTTFGHAAAREGTDKDDRRQVRVDGNPEAHGGTRGSMWSGPSEGARLLVSARSWCRSGGRQRGPAAFKSVLSGHRVTGAFARTLPVAVLLLQFFPHFCALVAYADVGAVSCLNTGSKIGNIDPVGKRRCRVLLTTGWNE